MKKIAFLDAQVVDALLNGSFLNLFRHFKDSAGAKSTSTTLHRENV
jgi:hypothetical protein